MARNRGGRLTGVVFAILGLAIGLSPTLKLYGHAAGESQHPVQFDSVDGALLGLGAALILLCLYFFLRRGNPG